MAFTTSSPRDELRNALVMCSVRSAITGSRLISLPFSDHCDPLVDDAAELQELLPALIEKASKDHYGYVELRPLAPFPLFQQKWEASRQYYHHCLDLRPGASAIFSAFHRDCIQRRIRHAERQGITITKGREAGILAEFYRLVVQTRRRHGLPPQPIAWFQTLLACLGDDAEIYCAHKGGEAIAGVFVLRHATSMYYKYGASAARFHRLGVMPYLFWEAIQDAINDGLENFDLGRSDIDNPGLITFKERWHSSRALLSYVQSSSADSGFVTTALAKRPLLQKACRYMPDSWLTAMGKISYPHVD